MQPDTFRYLTSAIAQVFAALVFGNAIFLGFLYERIRHTYDDSFKALDEFLDGCERRYSQHEAHAMDDFYKKHGRRTAEYKEGRFSYLVDLAAAIRKLMADYIGIFGVDPSDEATVREMLGASHEHYRHLVEEKVYLDSHLKRLQTLHADLSHFAGNTVLALTVPSFICVMALLLLACTDRLDPALGCPACCVLSMAFLGFFFVLYKAYRLSRSLTQPD